MERLLLFQVAGRPIGKGRPRSRIVAPHSGKAFVSHYTPPETADYEEAVGWRAREAMRGLQPFAGPLALIVTAVIKVPDSWSKAKRAAALAHEIRPTGAPDWDNLGKICSDGMNKIVFPDDRQIVDGRSIKFYGEIPFIQIEVLRP